MGNGWIPVGPRWAGDFFPPPGSLLGDEENNRRESPKARERPESFRILDFDNYMDDISSLKKEVDSYVDAGMNYFILGMSGQNASPGEKIEKVRRDIIASL